MRLALRALTVIVVISSQLDEVATGYRSTYPEYFLRLKAAMRGLDAVAIELRAINDEMMDKGID